MLKIAAPLFVAYVGYALGKADLQIHLARTAVTVLVAMILHGLVQLALPHDGIERIARAAAWSLLTEPTFVIVALLETAGIWVSVLVIHWAALRTRLWAAAYIIGAATLGALVFYEPFDAHNEPHPQYEAALAIALVIVILPFAVGRVAKRKERTVASQGALQSTSEVD
jgi:hypothetical protein